MPGRERISVYHMPGSLLTHKITREVFKKREKENNMASVWWQPFKTRRQEGWRGIYFFYCVCVRVNLKALHSGLI